MEITTASKRRILIWIFNTVTRLEGRMATLEEAVQNLVAEVGTLGERVAGQVDNLRESLASAQQALADFTAADVEEDADYEALVADLRAQLDTALVGAQAAADKISGAVDTIKQVAEETPTGPEGSDTPVEPEVPSEPPTPEGEEVVPG